jgi:uncharacterized protein (UPF0333 family)
MVAVLIIQISLSVYQLSMVAVLIYMIIFVYPISMHIRSNIRIICMSAYSEHKTSNWTIHDFIEEMIYIAEVIEVPGMSSRMTEIKEEVVKRFTEEERESSGLMF